MRNTDRAAFGVLSLVAAICFLPFRAGATELYSFVTMWPDVPQAWRFASPFGVAVDSSGNVFVADTNNHRIKKFDLSGNLLHEWGSYGEGDGQFRSPHGIVVDTSGNVYVVDTGNWRVQKFDSSGNFLGKWGSRGSDDGQFAGGGYEMGPGPIGIALDTSGNVLVADTENHRVQKFDSSGNYLAKWGSYGTSDGKFSRPHGVAVEPSGAIFVLDTGNHRVQKFDSSANYLRQWGLPGSGNKEFRYPRGIAVAGQGSVRVLVADSENERIQEFDTFGVFLAAWGQTGCGDGEFGGLPGWTGSTAGPSGVAVDFSGAIFVADTYNDRLQKFDSSGNFLAKWGYRGGGDGEFQKPGGIGVDSSADVFVVDSGNHRIQKFDSSGNFLTKWGRKGSGDGEFSWPFLQPPGIGTDSLAQEPSGAVYVADTGNARVQKFDSFGNFLEKWGYYDPESGGAPLQPYGIAVNPSGNVLVTDAEHSWVVEFDSSGNFVRKWGTLGTGDGQFKQPGGIAVSSSGSVFVADTGNHRIQKLDSFGGFLLAWGSQGSNDGEFVNPYGIAVDSSGDVFVADVGNNRIQKFDSSGNFLMKWGEQGLDDGEFNAPRAVAVDSSGNVFVADSGNHRVQKFRRVQPVISLDPTSLSNSCDERTDAPSQSFEVWNSAAGTLSYTVGDDVSWLFCDPSSGSSDGEHDTIVVSYTTAGLDPGTYFAAITVSDPDAANSPQEVDVTLTVRPSTLAIECQPTSLYSVCDQGLNALPKTFELWNPGAGTLSYTITDDAPWLFCNPTSGTSTGEHDLIRVTYNAPGLAAGTYSARITITDPYAINSPQHVEVTLTVRPRAATIGCQPVSLSNYCEEGQDAPSQSFEVWNAGGGVLAYLVSDDAAWLSCSPPGGTSSGEHDTITANYAASGLEPGTYSGTITVSDPNATNSPRTIGVTMTVHAVTPEGTLRVGSEMTTEGDETPFPLTVSLDLPYDLTYLAASVHFRGDLFSAVSYAASGRAAVEPAPDGIDNDAGEVRLVWLSLTGESVVPAGSGPVATILFEQNAGTSEGTYPVTLSEVEARYGPQSYRLAFLSGEIRVIHATLDVDRNGAVEPPTDIVYIHRYLAGLPEIVPSRFREIDPSIPSEDVIQGRIDLLGTRLDVDASGGDPDPATDIVYIYRYLVGMPKTVPSEFRDIDPSIPPDEEINARIDAINIAGQLGAFSRALALPTSASAELSAGVLKVAPVAGRAGTSITVPVVLDAPDEDLSYLRLWLAYDKTKLVPKELLKAGRTSAEPMPDWLDEENGRIRAVIESLNGDVVIPGGFGPVLILVFDVLGDTSTSESLVTQGGVAAGLGPKQVPVVVLHPVGIALAPGETMSLTWQPFGSGQYTVLSCDDLRVGNWMPVPGTDWPIGETSWQGEQISDLHRRFYRIKSE